MARWTSLLIAFAIASQGSILLGQEFSLTVGSPEVIFDPDTGAAEFVAQVVGLETSDDDAETEGFSLSFSYDGAILMGSNPRVGPELETINDGDGPDFSAVNIADDDDGVVAGVVYSLFGLEDLVWDDDVILVQVDLETDTDTFFDVIDQLEGGTSELNIEDDLPINGSVISEVVVVGGISEVPDLVNGTITFVPEETRLSFLRGDVNGNGDVSALIDALALMTWAFVYGDEPPCMAAADCDGSGSVSALLDALFLLDWAFGDGDVPPDPGTEACGVDPNELDCEVEADACL